MLASDRRSDSKQAENWGTGKMRVAKLRVGIVRVEVRAKRASMMRSSVAASRLATISSQHLRVARSIMPSTLAGAGHGGTFGESSRFHRPPHTSAVHSRR